MTLQHKIAELAESFAQEVIAQIKTRPIEEWLGNGAEGVHRTTKAKIIITDAPAPKASKKKKPGRLPRRSEKDIQQQASAIVTLLKKSPEGLRSEAIQKALQIDKRELPRPMLFALQSKLVKKTGAKRATTYFAR